VLAGVIQATGDAARAARLFGAAEMLLQSLDAVLDPAGSLEYESNLARARTQMRQEAFGKAWQGKDDDLRTGRHGSYEQRFESN